MALDDTIAVLSDVPIIGFFERDALRLIAFSAETRRLRPGDVVFRAGERADGGYVVLSGSLVMTRGAGAEDVVAGPGALVGRLALFLRTQRPGTATARERSELLRISPTLMRRVMAEFPAAAASVRDSLAEDLSEFTGHLQKVRAMLDAIAPR